MQICQIVGYKNSGKTTVMSELIRHFSARDIRVGSLKHHGHGGEPDRPKNTDSSRHFESGSIISGVQGENSTQFTVDMPFRLDELISIYQSFPIDLLLIEGYKQADYPKIVLVKSAEELSLLKDLTNIIAVGSWDEELPDDTGYPTFAIHNIQAALPQLADCIRRCYDG
ncbi:molybdopterin-guanine dinucleotide biosynthesis protein B [Virgibacillus doumboii]|uniref:molybdopterin-guanine dinucleotide biosynthesis protein B n=1 Tax=Virgibacillus doumboii TaxID=2697503 RepID=UPI0013E01621|nr:molybdopterin-guanine dinucleotide biosynthesis protein B [Virgibacillus doumboii]